MKERIVLWGANDADEKLLLALNLRADENEFDLLIWPESSVDEAFYKKMLFDWREGKDVEFDSDPKKQVVPLKVADSLLPDGIRTDKTDIVNRAQTEWHFIVLSSKLNQVYTSELEDLKDRIEKLELYDKSVWEELKGFWDKVQEQVREKNLFHDHVKSLRESTNGLFEHMKSLRAKLDDEFAEIAKKNYEVFNNALAEIEARLSSNEKLKDGFEELKKIQKQFHNAQLTKDLRNKVWNRLDAAFKAIKEARFGSATDKGNSAVQRLQRRLDGLLNAMQKMQNSIDRDKQELEFQKQRVDESDGQLESQLRQAKILMIEERIRSKSEKVEEMNKTKAEIEGKMVREKAKEAKLQDRQKREEIKEEIKKEIKNQIVEQQEQILEQEGENLIKAAAALGVNLPEQSVEEENKKSEAAADAEEKTAEVTAIPVPTDVVLEAEVVTNPPSDEATVVNEESVVPEKVEETEELPKNANQEETTTPEVPESPEEVNNEVEEPESKEEEAVQEKVESDTEEETKDKKDVKN